MGAARRALACIALTIVAAAGRAQDPCIRCDVLYASDCSTGLWAITPATGAATRIGFLPTIFVDLAITRDGRLIGVSEAFELWEISACGGAARRLPGPSPGNGLAGDHHSNDVFVQGPPLVRTRTDGSGASVTVGGAYGPGLPGWCGGSIGDLALSPHDGLLRSVLGCFCLPSRAALQVIDPATGEALRTAGCLASSTGTAYQTIYGIAYDSTSLWGVDRFPRLLRIDPDTAIVEERPITGGFTCGFGLAARPCVLPPDPCTQPPDQDGDGVADSCDSCPRDPNPAHASATDCNADGDATDRGELAGEQCDRDGDAIGDPCDCFPDDGTNPPLAPLQRLHVTRPDARAPEVEIAWDPVPEALGTNVYRGYVPAGARFADARATLQCFAGGDVRARSVRDGLRRPHGVLFYLASSFCIGQDTTLGTDSFGVERWAAPFVRPGCPEPLRDGDGDGVQDAEDTCPTEPDPAQDDGDGDFVGDACDGCPLAFDPRPGDLDLDGTPDACDCDRDDDGVLDDARDVTGADCGAGAGDNCPDTGNPAQDDADADGCGDACDAFPGDSRRC